ncbi:hypothetical protein CKAN_02559800 [Cinnamomum micranthum f. kanehirae]|uniref:RING-type E3 ubiquitin transferase n=1 Tax=Cinnamomum micranthum f. kanehirae TaxID=337451 RepID=A0A3S3NJ80_9MAGN|nr:hypothetical protein CKAN_02559800 [Cinnamomum micranthum f. kanehirae]
MATLNPHPKSTVRISPLLILTFLSIFFTPTSSRSPAKIPYSEHCSSVIPESTSNGHELEPLDFLQLHGGFFKGGEKFLSNQTPDSFSYSYYPKSARFYTKSLHKTDTEGVLKVHATLTFNDGRAYGLLQNSSSPKWRRRRQRSFYYGEASVSLELEGFWSRSTGKLCMVGTGYGLSEEVDYVPLSAVTNLNYPNRSDINTSIVTGTVESIGPEDSPGHFSPISVLGFSQKTYSYSLVEEIEGKCGGGDPKGEKSLVLEPVMRVCSVLSPLARRSFDLNYGSDCSGEKCSPFDGFRPKFMSFGGIQCSSEGEMRMYVRFSNLSYAWFGDPLNPETGLVAEGVWDKEKNQLCVVGCRLKNFEDSLAETHVGDCSVGLSLTFPKVWSLNMRSPAVGSIWTLKKSNDRIGFQSLGHPILVSELKYNYTESGQVNNLCAKKDRNRKSGETFPDGSSFTDMRFDMSLKTKSGGGWGSATPLSLGEVLFDPYSSEVFTTSSSIPEPNTTALPANSNHNLLNVSYSIDVSFWHGNTTERMQISAEGIYDSETGTLCMVGCRSLGRDGEKTFKNVALDCKILINLNFAPYNSEAGEHLEATIKSTRKENDPLHFEELKLSSHDIYGIEAKETIWRMDCEIAMVLISLTLACVFNGLQLYYVRRHPDVIPSISILMLVVLTLGHMIPLVLNFEAFFFRGRNQQNFILWSGGWLEANEVLVRVVTMVAFLLQFRLLQFTFSARLAEGSKKNLWDAEKKATWVCLLLYLVGGLFTWLVHSNQFKDTVSPVISVAKSHRDIWQDLKSFAGLVLDGFLLPQILLNLFWDSKAKALAPSYYGGTTLVRSLPHAYDAYRAHKSLPYVNSTYIYADPGWDLYSAAWDVIIPCGGLLFAFLIFLQQRFGGAVVLPRRFRQSAEYEKVPVVDV